MVKIRSRVFISFFATMFSVFANAQDSLKNEQPRMADAMRSDGKIYVVVTVLVIILIGLFLYLVNTDKKISRLESKLK